MNAPEALSRIRSGDIPVQPFYHGEMRGLTYKWVNRYQFSDGAVVTARVIRTLLSRREVQLILDGNTRRVEACEPK